MSCIGLALHGESLTRIPVPLAVTQDRVPLDSEAAGPTSNNDHFTQFVLMIFKSIQVVEFSKAKHITLFMEKINSVFPSGALASYFNRTNMSPQKCPL